MSKGLFIAGTSTEVGKTYVASLIARALVKSGRKVGVYKPAASGCVWRDGQLISEDAEQLWQAAGSPGTLEEVCPQRFEAAVAPHVAAHMEGRQIDRQLLRDGLDVWRERSDVVLVEGAGGLMSPISDDDYNADLAREFGYPLVVVAANTLGVINHTLQTLITARNYRGGMDVAAVVLNQVEPGGDASVASNRQELLSRCEVERLGVVTFGGEVVEGVEDWGLRIED